MAGRGSALEGEVGVQGSLVDEGLSGGGKEILICRHGDGVRVRNGMDCV